METLVKIFCPCIKRDDQQNEHRKQDGQLQHQYRHRPHSRMNLTNKEINQMIFDELESRGNNA